MASAANEKQREFLKVAAPLLERADADLRILGGDASDLAALVAVMEIIGELKDLAEKEREKRTYQFSFALEETLSGVLCGRFDDPSAVQADVLRAMEVLPEHFKYIEAGGEGGEPESLSAPLARLFELLEVPPVDFPQLGLGAEEFLFVGEEKCEAPEQPAGPGAEYVEAAAPLLDKISLALVMLDGKSPELMEIVGVNEQIEALKDLAARHCDEPGYQFTHGMSEILSGVLCEMFDDPEPMIQAVNDHFLTLKRYIETLGGADAPTPGDLSKSLESLFDLLGAPLILLPAAGDGAESLAAPTASALAEEKTDDSADEAEEKSSTGLPAMFDDTDLYKEFAFECNEHLETIEESILELENTPDDTDLINQIFRPIHSIKGGGGFLSLIGMSKLAHDTETLLDRCRKGDLEVTARIVEVCLLSVDALKNMVSNLVSALETPDPISADVNLVVFGPIRDEIHDILAGGSGVKKPEEAPAPAPAPPTPAPAIPLPTVTVAPAVSEEVNESDETQASKGVPSKIEEDDLDLLKRFVQQCNEHTELIEEQILGLEENPDDSELINGIFRAIHSIKGDSGFLYLAGISCLAHDTETLLDRLRTKKIPVSNRPVELCLQSVDALKQMIGNLSVVVEAGGATWSGPEPYDAAIEAAPLVIFGPLRKRIQDFLAHPDENELPKLGEILVESGDLTPEQLQNALDLQAAPLGEVLSKTGVVESQKVDKALEQQRSAGGAGVAGAAKAIKVDTEKIDSLVNLVGELVIIEAQVAQMVLKRNGESESSQGAAADQLMEKNLSQLRKITSELQERSMTLRMMPIKQTFQKMTRLVRDASKKMGKKIQLVMSGEDTELDKSVVEQIGDPLVHMLRNSVDHGIEPPDGSRQAAGKPEAGLVNLDAFYQGDEIKIQVRDDGRGLDREAILRKATKNGIVAPGVNLSDTEVWDLLFAPGFSMAKEVTDISGRGVGMDVVKRNVEKLRGHIKVESVLGRGSTFTISLPLTLAIIDGMVVRVGEEQYIIPTVAIRESLRPRREDMSTVTGRGELVNVRGELTPLVRLYDLWNIEPRETDPCKSLVVIVENTGRRACIMVDELVGQQQIVIKNLGDQFSDVRGIMGATILGDGRVGLILDIDGVMKRAQG